MERNNNKRNYTIYIQHDKWQCQDSMPRDVVETMQQRKTRGGRTRRENYARVALFFMVHQTAMTLVPYAKRRSEDHRTISTPQRSVTGEEPGKLKLEIRQRSVFSACQRRQRSKVRAVLRRSVVYIISSFSSCFHFTVGQLFHRTSTFAINTQRAVVRNTVSGLSEHFQ